jgi:hypothetical protein
VCVRMCRGKEMLTLFLFCIQDENPTLGNCKCNIITVSTANCGSVKTLHVRPLCM